MGRGSKIFRSTKQKLSTKGSMETEIVGLDDFMLEICWTRYFIAAKGYNVKDNCLHQDNKSSIIMENNGEDSSINCTKHINIWYFFINNRVNKGEVSVVWCPTGDMIGYYMTKPLKGDVLQKFRDQIMGVIPDADLGSGKVKVEQPRKV